MDSPSHTYMCTHTHNHTHTNTTIIVQKKEDMNLSWVQEWIIYEGLEETAG